MAAIVPVALCSLAVLIATTARGATLVRRVSLGANGVQAVGAFASSGAGSVSDDGRFVAFRSQAHNLVPSGAAGVLVRDRLLGTTEHVMV